MCDFYPTVANLGPFVPLSVVSYIHIAEMSSVTISLLPITLADVTDSKAHFVTMLLFTSASV